MQTTCKFALSLIVLLNVALTGCNDVVTPNSGEDATSPVDSFDVLGATCLPPSGEGACGQWPCCNPASPSLTASGENVFSLPRFAVKLSSTQLTVDDLAPTFEATLVVHPQTQTVRLILASGEIVETAVSVTSAQAQALAAAGSVQVELEPNFPRSQTGYLILRDATSGALLLAVGDGFHDENVKWLSVPNAWWLAAVQLPGVELEFVTSCGIRLDSFCQRDADTFDLVIKTAATEQTLQQGESTLVETPSGRYLFELQAAYAYPGGGSCTCAEHLGLSVHARVSPAP